ncbi:TerB family tellurite resistance protein [Halomonas sp. ISL-60]|uniref:hypothetical protein n=1 Tax=unclassified Halomonas TaxID=2609666 RepID=UPI0007D98B8C|nr:MULTISPECIES: hypothetical protein [unclassified Halomonas]MBT2771614.1 TerB family tellurite resistance protein [Halomonas sp. ISL-60]MBT2788400.1 TerB family tellurite resistance protein [Halomonas sp. ISL-106]MBT2797991.1 TerB family tellurite resistance protein [Halomonas sp. ISL-104]MBT2803105.1 TerB family tellurite resistance protein [Halomonas sp. ISL-56]OAL60561.1 hypothetical protein A6R74_17700 [Halomonas sp. ALS9]
MHIILGALGSIATILWVLYRFAELGVDLGGLNPFLWRRRRRWRKQYDANPIYSIEKPIEAAALALTATAKVNGEISSEEKRELLAIFENEFHVSKREAVDLLASSTFLIGRGDEIRNSLEKVLAPSVPNFTSEQAESVLNLANKIAKTGGEPTAVQIEFISSLHKHLMPESGEKAKWS